MLALLGWLTLQARSTEAQDTRFDRVRLLSRNIGWLARSRKRDAWICCHGITGIPHRLSRLCRASRKPDGPARRGKRGQSQPARARGGHRANRIGTARRLFAANITRADMSHARAVAYVKSHSDRRDHASGSRTSRPISRSRGRSSRCERCRRRERLADPYVRVCLIGHLDDSAQVCICVATRLKASCLACIKFEKN